ncbi:cysteine/glutathione ABC transporter membrane/ATP-binding component [Escherichia coli O104:H4 str. LB226692]|nr:cysteine/glutathione ABC transporter membrane/ATP-binding component [Escherichia coli O104:H4 str. LB226692]
MRALLPYLALYKRHKWMLSLGIVLAIVTLLASIGLLTLSGWFLSASAVAGLPDCTASTICYPLRACVAQQSPVLPGVILNVW